MIERFRFFAVLVVDRNSSGKDTERSYALADFNEHSLLLQILRLLSVVSMPLLHRDLAVSRMYCPG